MKACKLLICPLNDEGVLPWSSKGGSRATPAAASHSTKQVRQAHYGTGASSAVPSGKTRGDDGSLFSRGAGNAKVARPGLAVLSIFPASARGTNLTEWSEEKGRFCLKAGSFLLLSSFCLQPQCKGSTVFSEPSSPNTIFLPWGWRQGIKAASKPVTTLLARMIDHLELKLLQILKSNSLFRDQDRKILQM